MCAASKNCEKFTKNPFLGVQDRSRSSMLINLKSLSLVLVKICSKSVPICNRFHTVRANGGKIAFLRGYPFLTPLFERNLLTQGDKILSLKTRILGAAQSEDFVILACTVLIQLTSVTDGRTDKQTDAQAMANWRAKHSAIARKNKFCKFQNKSKTKNFLSYQATLKWERKTPDPHALARRMK